jgi:membrane-bound lytic murein transglycosylase D
VLLVIAAMSRHYRFSMLALGMLVAAVVGTATSATGDDLVRLPDSDDAVGLAGLIEEPPTDLESPTAGPEDPLAEEDDAGPLLDDPWSGALSASVRWAPGFPEGPVYPVVDRPEVRRLVEQLQSYGRPGVAQWLERSGRYVLMIQEVLRRKGLPEDLVFTAMVESGFNPVAVSRVGAKGLWQFMAPTARRYGLRVDRWVDERLDPEKSTLAAANYLRDLHSMFGSWHLVQAAYNAGEARISRALQVMRTTDFWVASRGRLIPNETKNFVAMIQALTLIGREPARYDFYVTRDEPVLYEVIPVPPATRLAWVATVSGVPAGELSQLNPELTLGQTPPGDEHLLKVPIGQGPAIQVALQGNEQPPEVRPTRGRRASGRVAAVPAEPRSKRIHVVRPRETLGAIAKRYGVSVTDIARWNQLPAESRIRPGDRLRLASLPSEEMSRRP